MARTRLKSGDEVIVIAGRDRGKRGRILKVDRIKGRVVVEGVNVVTRHLKRNPQNPQSGGRVQRPAPIDISNVMAWSAADEKAVRVRYKGTGRNKRRVAAGSGETLTSAGTKKARKASKEKPSSSEE